MDQSRESGREQARLVTLAETLAPTLAPTPDLTNFAMAIGYRSKRLFHLPRNVNGTKCNNNVWVVKVASDDL